MWVHDDFGTYEIHFGTCVFAVRLRYMRKYHFDTSLCRYRYIARERHFFAARRNARIASAILAAAIPSVRLSVCPSHAGIVSKRRHVARCSFHCWIAKSV